jgi:hypothetical protein
MWDPGWGGVYRNNIKIDMWDIGWGGVYRNNIKIDMGYRVGRCLPE